jgi:hopanoid biosynthesis associated RND transporter like protein HpnN
LREAATSGGGALALTAIAASISFFSFLPTDYVGLAELGLIAGCGMFIALIFTYLLMPALMTLVRPRFLYPISWESDRRVAFTLWMRRHAGLVAGIAALLGVGGLAIAPQARFNFDPLHLKDPDSESVSTLLDLLEDDPTTAYAINVLADDLTAAAELAQTATTIEGVHSTRTILDFVPDNQDEKLNIIADLAFLIEPALTTPQMNAPNPAEVIAAYDSLRDSLKDLAARFENETGQTAARLVTALDTLVSQSGLNAEVLHDLHFRLLGRLPRQMVDLRRSLQAEPVSLETLPASLRDYWVAADGQARVDIFPEANLYVEKGALRRFVTAVQHVMPNATGTPVTIYEAGEVVMGAFVQAAVIASIAIAVMLLMLLQSIKYTLLVFAPLTLAAIFTVAAAVLIGMPFNFANVIVLPLLFGLGVAGSLQIVIRERKVGGEAGSLSTSTPRAVTFSALTTIASFGSLALSNHPGIVSMGVLLAIAIATSVACNLFVLPAILVLTENRGRRTEPIW